MKTVVNKPIIGIDRGASFTDFAVVESGEWVETFSIEKRDWQSIRKVYDRLRTKYQTSHSVFSGSVANMPASLAQQVKIIAEIDAVGFGGATLADCDDCIVVSMGTGTAIVHFKESRAKHVGGTGLGGGTIVGLSSLICGLDDPAEIEARALKGNASRLNLTIADLGYEGLSFLGADVTASNFAAIQSRKTEDLTAAILRMVGETVGIIASICARECNCPDRIVMIGKVSGNRFIRNVLNLVGQLYQTTFIFPENPGYATVYGAAMKCAFDLRNSPNWD
jgi:type II pantothenate kinase